jgi:hypothetical protein
MPVFFGLLALVPFPNSLNVTRLRSTFAVIEGLIDVTAHIDDEAEEDSRGMNKSPSR